MVTGNQTTAWLGSDTQEWFRRRRRHSVFDESSVEYRINSHGYRCPEFTELADIRMISIGCSVTMGVGLPQHTLFHERFAERLRRETGKTVVNWNFAEIGTGNDVVERALHLAVPVLDPHIVLILFPEIGRREYISPAAARVCYVPALGQAPAAVNRLLAGTQFGAVFKKLAGISSQHDDELRFFRSYKSIEALLSGRCWLFGFVKDQWMSRSHVFKHTAADRYIGGWRPQDRARDIVHPGPATHEAIFRGFWCAFESIRSSYLWSGSSDFKAS
jgi:hypothetical protein